MAQACLCGKLRCEIDVKVSAEEMYAFYSRKTYQITKSSPEIFQSIELFKGHWGEEGSVISLNYYMDGKYSSAKEEMKVINDKNKTIIFNVIEGELLDYYNSMKFIVEITPKEDKNGSLVNCCLEYEKLNDNIPDPNSFLHSLVRLTKDIEAYLSKN